MGEKVEVRMVPKKLSIYRFLLSKLPGFCSYCGKKYVCAYSNKINLFNPVPQNGKICPNGHEGYMNENILCCIVRHHIDNVKKSQEIHNG